MTSLLAGLIAGRTSEEIAALTRSAKMQTARLRIARECPTGLDLAERLDAARTVRTPALEFLNRRIHETMRTPSGRLVISIPPQEGKSHLMQRAIVRRMVDNPDGRFGFASYSAALARRSGRIVRGLLETHEETLGLGVARDRRDAADWEIRGHRGGMFSVGVGGSLTGRPIDAGLVVDDPTKDQQDAESLTVMEGLVDWWETVALTRLAPGAWVIVIQTRWDEKDLAGRLIGAGWPHINIPALADGESVDALNRPVGEYLVSALGRNPADWVKRRNEMGERAWYALCQGMPSPPAGGIYLREWFDRDRVDSLPDGCLPPVVVVDPADNIGTGDEAGIVVACTGSRGEIYLGPDLSGHMTTGRWVRVALLAVAQYRAGSVAYETSLSGLDRSIRAGWVLLYKQARVLARLRTPGAVLDPDVIEVAAAELCHPHDPGTTWEQTRVELAELWDLVDAVLAIPASGPPVRKFAARGTKQLRMQLAAPVWEQRRVHHIGRLPEMEWQLVTWKPGQDSPDRADVAVHAVMLLSGATVATIAVPDAKIPTRSTRRTRGGGMIGRSTRR